MNAPADYLGREIKVDDLLVYPVRRGSHMWLNRIKVTMVTPDFVKGFSPEGRPVTIRNLKNAIVCQPPARPTV